MKYIDLTQAMQTLIDDEDFERSNKHKWCASKNPDGSYVAVRSIATKKGRRLILMHREIMNAPKGLLVDHRNHNTLDNRKSNLRICTNAENCRNKRVKEGYSSKCKGVHWNKLNKNWRARIMVNYIKKELGSFTDEKDAAQAYNEAALKYFGEFALLNT